MTSTFKMLVQAKKNKSKKRGRPAKPRPIYVSKKLEIAYTRALIAIVDDIHKTTVNELKNITELNIGDSKIVNDGLFDDIMQRLKKIKNEISTVVGSKARAIASIFVNGQKKQSDEQLVKIIEQQTGLDLTSVIDDDALQEPTKEAIQANIILINSIPEQYLYRVEQVIMAGLQSGLLSEALKAELQKIYNTTRNRAKLIASDQMGKINSRMTEVRQKNLGIVNYQWSTAQDERVRGNPNGRYPKAKYSHYHRHGKIFSWNKPPPDGHPGQAVRCRCVAIPVLEYLD